MLKSTNMPRLRMAENITKAVCYRKYSILSISGSVCASAGEEWLQASGGCESGDTVYSVASRRKPVGAELLKQYRRTKKQKSFLIFLMLKWFLRWRYTRLRFFWLRFWNLYYFFVIYVKILRFYQKSFWSGHFWGGVRFFIYEPFIWANTSFS